MNAGLNRGREDSDAKENNYMMQPDKASVSLGYVDQNFDMNSLNA